MINDLLSLFRVTSAEEPEQWVDLGAVMARTLETLRPQAAAKEVRLEVGNLPQVWAQEGKLAHVMANLLGNAVKYAPSGSGWVRVEGHLGNGEAVLSVSDNGPGIPAAHHEKIFELFRRVPVAEGSSAQASGTGVGLAVVKRVVESHGGRVWVDSAPGRGSTFFVTLPARARPSGPGAPAGGLDPDRPRSSTHRDRG